MGRLLRPNDRSGLLVADAERDRFPVANAAGLTILKPGTYAFDVNGTVVQPVVRSVELTVSVAATVVSTTYSFPASAS